MVTIEVVDKGVVMTTRKRKIGNFVKIEKEKLSKNLKNVQKYKTPEKQIQDTTTKKSDIKIRSKFGPAKIKHEEEKKICPRKKNSSPLNMKCISAKKLTTTSKKKIQKIKNMPQKMNVKKVGKIIEFFEKISKGKWHLKKRV